MDSATITKTLIIYGNKKVHYFAVGGSELVFLPRVQAAEVQLPSFCGKFAPCFSVDLLVRKFRPVSFQAETPPPSDAVCY